jgi:hypothetical protein
MPSWPFSETIALSSLRSDWQDPETLNDTFVQEPRHGGCPLRSPPKNKLEKLEDDREGQHAIRINDQYRICFVWADGAEAVEITDYH